MQAQAGSDAGTQQDTFKYLSTFLTLQKAEERGFRPEAYNLSPDDAGKIATVFSRYDTNDDMVLEKREVTDLLYGPLPLACCAVV